MTAGQAEQKTMEEILASIRQIISDDEAKTAKRTAGPESPTVETTDPGSRRLESVASEPDKVSRLFGQDRPRPVGEERPPRPAAGQQAVDAAIDRAMGAAGLSKLSVRPTAKAPAAPTAAERKVSPFRLLEVPPPARSEGDAEDHEPLPRIVRAEAAGPAADPAEPLLSADAVTAAAGSFEELAAAVRSAGGRPLATLVEQTLRPMLKSWLDENLPPLVERLVREEIERIQRRR